MIYYNFRALIIDALEEMNVKPTTTRVQVLLKLLHDAFSVVDRVPRRKKK